MQFRHIIIPTFVTPAISSLPNLNPFDSTIKWLASAVTRIALSQRTVMIDRVLAEDLAEIFEVDASEIPADVGGILDFIVKYIDDHSEEGVPFLSYRLQVVAGRLYDMMEKMIANLDG